MSDGCVLNSGQETIIHNRLFTWKVPHWSNVPLHELGVRLLTPKRGDIDKRYLALVSGSPPSDEFSCDLPIGPQLPDLLTEFKTVRERKSLMLYGFWDDTTIDLSARELPPGGCAITGMVKDPDTVRRRYVHHKES